MIIALLVLALVYSYVLILAIVTVRRERLMASQEDSGCALDDQERLWTALDDIQLLRLLREGVR